MASDTNSSSLDKAERCMECHAKAHSILSGHRGRALDDAEDADVVSSSLSRHVGSEAAHKLVSSHDGCALDDQHDYARFHRSVRRALHAKHGVKKNDASSDSEAELYAADVFAALTKALGDKIEDLKKMDLPKSVDKAIGGQESKASIPTDVKVSGNAEGVQKGEPCDICGTRRKEGDKPCHGVAEVDIHLNAKKSKAKPAQKMELPSSPDKANGGQESKASIPTDVKVSGNPEGVQKSEYSAADVMSVLNKTIGDKIEALKSEMEKMQKAEAAGNATLLRKGVGSLPSETPSAKQIADGDANRMAPSRRSVFDVMKKGEWKPRPGKEVSAEGSGGDVTKGKLSKEALSMSPPKAPALKPAGVPAAKAGEAPKAPKPPGAAGANPTMHKMDLPQSDDKANGGQKSKESIPTDVKVTGNPEGTQKMELPQSPKKASGGQMKKEEKPMAKAMHPSPVFKVNMNRNIKTAMQHDPTSGPPTAPMAAPKSVTMPSPEEHASRANQFADFTPPGKFGKAELDSAKCPGCKNGMTLCKCK